MSLEGTAAGIAAAAGFSTIAIGLGQANYAEAGVCAAAAVMANIFESFLGALEQGKLPWLSNDMVNALQICVAAALAIVAKQQLLA